MDSDNDLFSASLEGIDSSKRVENFQRFFSKFQRECDVSLNNAREWIKAELPIVASSIDLAPLKEELKSNKISTRRKHLLSALIFEQATHDAVHKHQAATAALMAMHMLNHIWQAKLELYEYQPSTSKSSQPALATSNQRKESRIQTQEVDSKREKILATLIHKGENQKNDSQLQKQNASAIQPSPIRKPTPQNNKVINQKQKDLWAEAAKKEKQKRVASIDKSKKPERKTMGLFSKVRTKITLKRKSEEKNKEVLSGFHQKPSLPDRKPEDSLLDDPNKSAIMVNSGIIKEIDDSLIQERPKFSGDPNESGLLVRKVLKKREQETHEPGSNTIIMKLSSSTGKSNNTELSIPEQCQQAVNRFYQQFPGYDIVAIRNLAAEKVGVSPQYISNLNILPERTK